MKNFSCKRLIIIIIVVVIACGSQYAQGATRIWEATSDPTAGGDMFYDIAVTTEGVYATGVEGGCCAGRVAKYTLAGTPPTGSLIWERRVPDGFASFGWNSYPRAIGVIESGPDTGVYLADTRHLGGFDYEWYLYRITLNNGDLDTTFGSSGYLSHNPLVGCYTGESPIDMAIVPGTGPEAGLYVVGLKNPTDASCNTIYQMPYMAKFSLDGNATPQWTQTADKPNNNSWFQTVAILPTGPNAGVYVGGGTTPSSREWLIQRWNLDGTPGSGPHGSVWEVIENLGSLCSSADIVRGIAVDGTGVYVVGQKGGNCDGGRWRLEKRQLSDGVLDTGFGTGGAVEYKAGPSCMELKGVTMDTSGVYAIGSYGGCGGEPYRWQMVKWDLNGNVLWSASGPPSPPSIEMRAVTTDATGVYMAGFELISCGGSCDYKFRIEKWSQDPFTDCGLRAYDGTAVRTIACEDTPSSQLRIYKDKVYGLPVVDTTDPNATKFRINTLGGVKALRGL